MEDDKDFEESDEPQEDYNDSSDVLHEAMEDFRCCCSL